MSGKDEELEVKFYISSPKEIGRKIIALGGRLHSPRVHEVNLRFDTPDLSLLNTGRLLRLRNDSRARVTYKGLGSIEGGARLRKELEFTVSNFDTTREVFEALGYEIYLMYEKYRTTYKLEDMEIVLDEMPYGYFVEIEGHDGEKIQAAAEGLGLHWEARILESYTVLFENARIRLGFGFRDLSFENFKGLSTTPEVLGVMTAD